MSLIAAGKGAGAPIASATAGKPAATTAVSISKAGSSPARVSLSARNNDASKVSFSEVTFARGEGQVAQQGRTTSSSSNSSSSSAANSFSNSGGSAGGAVTGSTGANYAAPSSAGGAEGDTDLSADSTAESSSGSGVDTKKATGGGCSACGQGGCSGNCSQGCASCANKAGGEEKASSCPCCQQGR
mgnify:CR=1 FL=1